MRIHGVLAVAGLAFLSNALAEDGLGASACLTITTTVFVPVELSSITYTLAEIPSTTSGIDVAVASSTDGPYYFNDNNGTTAWLGNTPSHSYGPFMTGSTSVVVVPVPLTSTFYVTRTLTEAPTVTSTVFFSEASAVSSAGTGPSLEGTGGSDVGPSGSAFGGSSQNENLLPITSTVYLPEVESSNHELPTTTLEVATSRQEFPTTTYVTSFITLQRTWTSTTSLLSVSELAASGPAVTGAVSSSDDLTTTIYLTSFVTQREIFTSSLPSSSAPSYVNSSSTALQFSSVALPLNYSTLSGASSTLMNYASTPTTTTIMPGSYTSFGIGGWNSSLSVSQAGTTPGTGATELAVVSTSVSTFTVPFGTSVASPAPPGVSSSTARMVSSIQFNGTVTISSSAAYVTGSSSVWWFSNSSVTTASTSISLGSSSSGALLQSSSLSSLTTTSAALSSFGLAINSSTTTPLSSVAMGSAISVIPISNSSGLFAPTSTMSQNSSGLIATTSAISQYSTGLFASPSTISESTSDLIVPTSISLQYSSGLVTSTSTASQNSTGPFASTSTMSMNSSRLPMTSSLTAQNSSGPSSATSTPTQLPVPTFCGESGNFTLNWDDEPIFTPADNATASYPPVFNPYHHLFFSNGYAYIPPPTSAFLPVSPPHMAIFLTGLENSPGNDRGSPGAAGLRPGEINDGPRGSIDAYWFDAFGAYFGCDNAGPGDCTMVIVGFAYDSVAGQDVQVVQQNATLPPCPGFINCQMSPVDFNGDFRSLSGIQIQAFVNGTVPKIWFMDDLRMGWFNNTCAAGLLRQRSRK